MPPKKRDREPSPASSPRESTAQNAGSETQRKEEERSSKPSSANRKRAKTKAASGSTSGASGRGTVAGTRGRNMKALPSTAAIVNEGASAIDTVQPTESRINTASDTDTVGVVPSSTSAPEPGRDGSPSPVSPVEASGASEGLLAEEQRAFLSEDTGEGGVVSSRGSTTLGGADASTGLATGESTQQEQQPALSKNSEVPI